MIARADMHRRLTVLAMAAALGFGCFACFVPAAPAGADWQGDLRRQLRAEYNCEIAYFSRMEVRKLDGREAVFVRAHCDDKRSFDARRQSEAERFEIEACDVQTC